MANVRTGFETKLLLLFAVVMVAVLSLGPGSLSFDEAKSRADSSMASLDSEQSDKLARAQRKFTERAIPMCVQSTATLPEDFAIVIDIAADGTIGRYWRRGDSVFVICYQKLLQEHFWFRPYSQPFFVAFEYDKASGHGL